MPHIEEREHWPCVIVRVRERASVRVRCVCVVNPDKKAALEITQKSVSSFCPAPPVPGPLSSSFFSGSLPLSLAHLSGRGVWPERPVPARPGTAPSPAPLTQLFFTSSQNACVRFLWGVKKESCARASKAR